MYYTCLESVYLSSMQPTVHMITPFFVSHRPQSPGGVKHIKLDRLIASVLVGHCAPVHVAGLS